MENIDIHFSCCFLILLLSRLAYGTSGGLQPLLNPTYWGPWSEWSVCSSQCGQGVETRTRKCSQWTLGQVKEQNSWQCEGYGRRRRICYGRCNDGPNHAQTDECTGLDSIHGRDWIQVKRGNQCNVVCRSTTNHHVKTIRIKKNGTPCQTFHIRNGECIGGLCKHIVEKCQDSEGRPLRVDKCMVCGGDNSTCHPIDGAFTSTTSETIIDVNGMSTVVRVPEGSTSIRITKYGSAMNTLGLVGSSSQCIINNPGWPSIEGKYKIDGVTWIYRNNASHEMLKAEGPTAKAATIMLTARYPRQVVRYSFWVPKGQGEETFHVQDGDYPSTIGSETSPYRVASVPDRENSPLEEDDIWTFLDTLRGQSETTVPTTTTSNRASPVSHQPILYTVSEDNPDVLVPYEAERDKSVVDKAEIQVPIPSTEDNRVRPKEDRIKIKGKQDGVSSRKDGDRVSKGKGKTSKKGKSKILKRRRKKKRRKRPNDGFVFLKPNEYYCYPCLRAKDKARQFCTSDFVSKVHINRRKVVGNETRYDVTILSSYRNNVRLLHREYIWLESTCRCPRIKSKRTYIVMGSLQHLSDRLTRLVITPKSFIRGFSPGFDRKIRQLTKTIKCSGK